MFIELFRQIAKVGAKMAKVAMAKLSSGVKRANQRMRELEKQGIENYSQAYKSLKEIWEMENNQNIPKNKRITGTTKDGKPKFNTSVSSLAKNTDDLQAMSAYLDNFMNAETSTVPGARRVKEIIDKSYESFKENNPDFEDIDREDYEDLFTRDLYSYLRQYFSSDDSAMLTNAVISGELDETKIREIVERTKGKVNSYEVWTYAEMPKDEDFTAYNDETDNPFK